MLCSLRLPIFLPDDSSLLHFFALRWLLPLPRYAHSKYENTLSVILGSLLVFTCSDTSYILRNGTFSQIRSHMSLCPHIVQGQSHIVLVICGTSYHIPIVCCPMEHQLVIVAPLEDSAFIVSALQESTGMVDNASQLKTA